MEQTELLFLQHSALTLHQATVLTVAAVAAAVVAAAVAAAAGIPEVCLETMTEDQVVTVEPVVVPVVAVPEELKVVAIATESIFITVLEEISSTVLFHQELLELAVKEEMVDQVVVQEPDLQVTTPVITPDSVGTEE
jgi:hypothetical protein